MMFDYMTKIEEAILGSDTRQDILSSKESVKQYAEAMGYEVNETDALTIKTVCEVYERIYGKLILD